jgi:single-stranded DNA-binding protein
MSVTKKWKNRSGEEQKDISWYKCSSWTEGLSNVIKSYVKAGAGVLVKGTPKATAYNDKDGNLKGQIEVNISEIITLTEPKEGWNDGNKNNSNQTPANSIEDDNIPF